MQVLGLGPTQADDVRRNADLLDAPTARADAIYTGVLYESLDLATLDPAARRRASRWLAVVSSVFGLVRPGDRIPSYRLSGGVNLPGLGVVSAHWRDRARPDRARGGRPRPGRRPALHDLRGLLASRRTTSPAKVATVRVLHEVGDEAHGGQPLQQGHQGPAGARAARERRHTEAHPPRSPTPSPTSAGRSSSATAAGTATRSTWSSRSSRTG